MSGQPEPQPGRFAEAWADLQPAVLAYVWTVLPEARAVEGVMKSVVAVLSRRYAEDKPAGSSAQAWAIGVARDRVLAERQGAAGGGLRYGPEVIGGVAELYRSGRIDVAGCRRALRKCASHMQGRNRRVLGLRYGHGMTLKQIGAQMGLDHSASRALLNRVRTALRRCIEHETREDGDEDEAAQAGRADASDEIIYSYLNGEVRGEHLARFDAWLRDDPGHLFGWARAMFLDRELRDYFVAELGEQGDEQDPLGIGERSAAARRGLLDQSLLATLRQLDAGPEEAPVIRDMTAEKRAQREAERELAYQQKQGAPREPGLTGGEAVWVAGDIARRVLLSRPMIALLVLLVVGVVAVVVLQRGPAPVSNTPSETQAQVPAPKLTAEITAEDDAVWELSGEGVLPYLGDTIGSGQSLKLLRGVAEVTLSDGAVALMQAPCRIGVNDAGNALRLYEGRVVCVVAASEGERLIAQTDLFEVGGVGARFGLDASEVDRCEVHVLEGGVEVSRQLGGLSSNAGAVPRLIESGQAARMTIGGDGLALIDSDPGRFAFSIGE